METFAIVHKSEFSGVETVVDAFQCEEKGDHFFRLALALALKWLTAPEREQGFQWPVRMRARKIGPFKYHIRINDDDPLMIPRRQGILSVKRLSDCSDNLQRDVFDRFIRYDD